MATKKHTSTKANAPRVARGADESRLKKLCTTIRTSLSGLSRAEQMAQAKTLYEAAFPEAKNGGAPGKAGGGKAAKNATVAGFVRFMAKETGLSPRAITYDVEIATGIVGTVRARITGTQLANSTRELITIAKLPESKQRAVVKTFEKEGLSAVRSVLRELTPKPDRKEESISPVEYEVPIGRAVEVAIGRARYMVTLLTFVDGVGKVSVSPRSGMSVEPKPVEQLDEEPSGSESPIEVVLGGEPPGRDSVPAAGHIGSGSGVERAYCSGPDWDALTAAPTDSLREGDAKTLAVEDSCMPSANVVRLLDIESDAYQVAYGGFADFVYKVIEKRGRKAMQLAADVGLVELGSIEPPPGATVLLGYGTKATGIWTVGIGKLDDRGELPEVIYAAGHGDDGWFVSRVALPEAALGEPLHIWVVPAVQDAAPAGPA